MIITRCSVRRRHHDNLEATEPHGVTLWPSIRILTLTTLTLAFIKPTAKQLQRTHDAPHLPIIKRRSTSSQVPRVPAHKITRRPGLPPPQFPASRLSPRGPQKLVPDGGRGPCKKFKQTTVPYEALWCRSGPASGVRCPVIAATGAPFPSHSFGATVEERACDRYKLASTWAAASGVWHYSWIRSLLQAQQLLGVCAIFGVRLGVYRIVPPYRALPSKDPQIHAIFVRLRSLSCLLCLLSRRFPGQRFPLLSPVSVL